MSLPPTLVSLSPSSGAAGTPVTITGANFGFSQSSNTVTFNGIPASATSWTPGLINVTAPSNATSGNVVVVVSGIASNGLAFGFNSPAPSSITVTPANQSIPTGATLQFTATELYTDGSIQNVTSTATWNSAATNVATISNTGLVSTLLTGQTTIQASVGSISGAAQLRVSDFSFTGSMTVPRRDHTATVLNNGSVLIAGGFNANGTCLSAELFNPATGLFSATGNMNSAHALHTATLLNNGMVLIAGGYDVNGSVQNLVELYDPSTGTFTSTASLNNARAYHTATLLNDGTVLITGGTDNNASPVASTEIFDPATGTFTLVEQFDHGPRASHRNATERRQRTCRWRSRR